MGSVLHLHRGLQRKESSLTAATERPESLLRPGHNVCAVALAERLSVLVDAEAYFRAFHRAALRAKRSITILGWDFNSQTRLHFDPGPQGGPPAPLGGLRHAEHSSPRSSPRAVAAGPSFPILAWISSGQARQHFVPEPQGGA